MNNVVDMQGFRDRKHPERKQAGHEEFGAVLEHRMLEDQRAVSRARSSVWVDDKEAARIGETQAAQEQPGVTEHLAQTALSTLPGPTAAAEQPAQPVESSNNVVSIDAVRRIVEQTVDKLDQGFEDMGYIQIGDEDAA